MKKFWISALKWLRTAFLAGIFVVVPIGISIWILIWIFNSVDGLLGPLVKHIFGRNIPGVGFGFTIVVIFVVGAIMSNVLGKRLVRWGEHQLGKVPLLNRVYGTLRDIFQSFSGNETRGFMQVVLVEFPSKGMHSIGFITNEAKDKNGKKIINVFIPHAPNPMTGYMQIVGEESITRTNISIEEGLKLVVSVGRICPPNLGEAISSIQPQVDSGATTVVSQPPEVKPTDTTKTDKPDLV
ncbi:MAG TPA: DUF502 domain-containing protein [Dehalococcoidales bacterium]|nr:DUF502 domain-containing protein [Dehalococcoidales bacterium]